MSDSEAYDFSDGEERKEMTQEVFVERMKDWKNAKDFVLNFGKFKGAPMKKLVKTRQGRRYLKYMLEWDDLYAGTKQAIQTAIGHYVDVKLQRKRDDSPKREREDGTDATGPSKKKKKRGRRRSTSVE